jgi:hypothetical protein
MIVRIIAIVLAAISLCMVFVAHYVSNAGTWCLQSGPVGRMVGLGPTPVPTPYISSMKTPTAKDAEILKSIMEAAKRANLPTTYTSIELSTQCRPQEVALGLEIGATILAALAVGLWTARAKTNS